MKSACCFYQMVAPRAYKNANNILNLKSCLNKNGRRDTKNSKTSRWSSQKYWSVLNSPVKTCGFAIWSREGLTLKRRPLSPSGRKPEKHHQRWELSHTSTNANREWWICHLVLGHGSGRYSEQDLGFDGPRQNHLVTLVQPRCETGQH